MGSHADKSIFSNSALRYLSYDIMFGFLLFDTLFYQDLKTILQAHVQNMMMLMITCLQQ